MLIGPIHATRSFVTVSAFSQLAMGGGARPPADAKRQRGAGGGRMTNEPLICIDRFATWLTATRRDATGNERSDRIDPDDRQCGA